MQDSRLNNAGRNMVFGMLLRGYQILMPFLMRTAFMYYMSLEYLGLNSLFGSVLFVLNLAELGVGSAMVYSMYQPIIDGNTAEICALVKLYRKYYRFIGLVIAIVGTILTPFIPYIIKGSVPDDISVYIVYLLNLFCTVMSYWLFAYKNSLLVAHQRNDVASKVMLVTNTVQYGLQFVTVAVFKDYYMYLVVAIITQIVTNIVTAYFAKKMYPDYNPEGELPPERIKTINGRIKDLFLMKFGVVVVSSADSIVISAFLGLTMVGIYNKYYYILTAVFGIVKVVFDSCTAGIGNSILVETEEKNYADLKKLTFLVMWMIGFCSVCLLCLYQPFMKLWGSLANGNYMLDYTAVVCLVLYFYLDRAMQLLITYKDAAGIWHTDRFRPLVTALANLIMNIILVQIIGLNGVMLSTVLSILLIGMPWIIRNLFKELFKRDAKEYVVSLLIYTAVTAVISVCCIFLCDLVPEMGRGGIISLIIKGVICVVVANAMYVLFYFKTKSFADTKQIVKRIIKRG